MKKSMTFMVIFLSVLMIWSSFCVSGVQAVNWNAESIMSSKHNVGQWTSLALDSADQPHICYVDPDNGDLKYAEWSSVAFNPGMADEDNGWIVKETVVEGAFSVGTSLKVDSGGNPHISYYVASTGDLKYASWTDGGWVFQTVDSEGDVGKYSSLALDASGQARISYYDASNHALKFAEWKNDKWHIKTVDDEGDVGQFSSLVLDSNGNGRISYYDASGGDLKYANVGNGNNWKSEVVDSVGDVGKYCSLKLDSGDNPRISYYDASNGDLKYAFGVAGKKSVSNWIIEVIDSAVNVGTFCSLALNSMDLPSISYYDSTNCLLKYAWTTASGWAKARADGANVGEFSSMVFTSEDKPMITYYDRGNGALRLASSPMNIPGASSISSIEDSFDNVGRLSSPAFELNDNSVFYEYASNGKVYALGVLYGNPPLWVASIDPYDPLGSRIVPSPTVNNGVLYIGTSTGKVYALDKVGGQIKWVYSTGENVLLSPPNVLPNLNGGTLVTVSETGNVYCLNIADGSCRWIYRTGNSIAITFLGRSSVISGVVIVPTREGNIFGIDSANGNIKWIYEANDVDASFLVPVMVFTDAVLGDAVVGASSNGVLYAVKVFDGTQKWRLDTGDHSALIYSGNSGTAYVTSGAGNLYSVNGATGAIKWSFTPPNGDKVSSTNPAFLNNVVFVGSQQGFVYALNSVDGSQRWSYSTGGSSLPFNVRVVGNVANVGSMLFAGSMDGVVHALNLQTGSRVWSYRTYDNAAPSAFQVVNFAGFDIVVFSGLSTGKIYSLDAPNGKVRFVNLFSDHVWSVENPSWAVQNGKLTPTSSSSMDFNNRATIVTEDYFWDKNNVNLNIQVKYTRLSQTGAAGIIFKYMPQSTDGYTKMPKTYVGVILRAGSFYFIKVINGVVRQSSETFYTFALNREYALRLEVYGSRIDVYVDGVLVAYDTVVGAGTDSPWSGTVGFNSNGAQVTFDDVKVTKRMQSELVDSGSIRNAKLLLDANGNPHVIIPDTSRGYWLYAEKTSAGWVSEVVLKGRYASSSFSFALDSNGNPCLVHQQLTTGKLFYTARVGGVWRTELVTQLPIGSSYFAFNPSLVVDAQGLPHVSFFDWTTGNLKYATKVGSDWSITTVYVGSGHDSSIAFDPFGKLHIAHTPTFTPLFYSSLKDGVWQTEQIDISYRFAMGPSLAIDSNNNSMITYSDGFGRYMGYATLASGSSEWLVNDFPVAVAWAPWFFGLDSAGKPYVCYYSYPNQDLMLARLVDGSWKTMNLNPGFSYQLLSAVSDSANVLRSVYVDTVMQKLTYSTTTIS